MPIAERAPARASAAPAPQRSRPQPATTAPPRRHLRVVPPERNRRPRLSPALGVVATTVVFVGLFALAVVHTLLVQGQIHLDQLDAEVAEQQASYQRLRLDLGQLESPERIVAEAESRLGMVSPDDVMYLSPEDPVPAADATKDDGTTPVDEVTDQGRVAGRELAQGEDAWSTMKPLLGNTP
jgi:cell division protein FtsL